jgi:hypothetical protein
VIDVFDNKYGKGKVELIQVEDLNAEGAFDDTYERHLKVEFQSPLSDLHFRDT